MNLSQAFRLSNPTAIAFVGAGGKTTAMFQLARELAPAIVTTTTHLGDWQAALADRHFVWEADAPMPEMESRLGAGVTLVTGGLAGNRYSGLSPAQTETLRQLAGYHALPLLIEADGARQKPLKAPAAHEPPIPDFVEAVVVVVGLSGLGQPLTDEIAHRAEIFGELAGQATHQPITAKMLAAVLMHPQGGMKNIPAGARRIALLNQADTAELQAQAGGISNLLLHSFDTVVIASLMPASSTVQRPSAVYTVHEKIAGIILAAGESSRFGQPKQLLDYHGQPFVRKVAQMALDAKLSPVMVVTGANAVLIEAALEGLPVVAIRNEKWQNGQSSSIKVGISALAPLHGTSPLQKTSLPHPFRSVGGAVFLLADQPQVTPHVIQALVERHATQRAAIVSPLAGDPNNPRASRRANPVLFDCDTFDDLLGITGDVGGRAIFPNYKVDYIPWHDESLLFDVDTEDDYQKLLAWGVKD